MFRVLISVGTTRNINTPRQSASLTRQYQHSISGNEYTYNNIY